MTTFDLDEVEAAFRNYWELGAVGEDWDAWCDECFTEDVTYIEHILGNKQGREAVRAWIKPTMEEYGAIYTAYEWHMVAADGRVVVYMQNRRDHPDASQPPIDFPGMTILQYAGGGKFSLEEDFWSLPEGIETAKRVGRGLPRHRPGVPEPAHPARLGQRPGLGAGRRDLRREPRRAARLE